MFGGSTSRDPRVGSLKGLGFGVLRVYLEVHGT